MIFLRYNRTLIEANCYVLADSEHRVALVVDPGAGAAAWIEETLASRRLRLGAVLCTHGHIDHVWDAGLISGDAPVYVPAPDLYRMEDPAAMGPAAARMFPEATGHPWIKPTGTAALPGPFFEGEGAQIVPGLAIRAIPAPGHTEGSSVFLLTGKIDADRESVVFPEGTYGESLMLGGDVLFRDGVGRTDLPGGDPVAASESLRTLASAIDPATIFFPGHGPSSTVGREKEHSYYLRLAIDGETA